MAFTCPYCSKEYCFYSGRARHIKSCHREPAESPSTEEPGKNESSEEPSADEDAKSGDEDDKSGDEDDESGDEENEATGCGVARFLPHFENHPKPIAKNFPLLKQMLFTHPKRRMKLIRHADASLRRAICECCLNILNDNVKIDNIVLKKLKPYKFAIRELGAPTSEVSKARKKHIFQKQKGGFLGSFLPIILGQCLYSLYGDRLHEKV